MTIAHQIDRAWLSTGGTGAQNYDEFADDREITAIIAANPDSALAVEMPHCAPESVGQTFEASLPAAKRRLQAAQAAGKYAPHDEVAVVYRISAAGDEAGGEAYGLWVMIDTDQISTSADEPGLVIRNEDVFIEKVRERVALAQSIGHLLSPVLLLATAAPEALHDALAATVARAGAPAVSDLDQSGRRHEIWPVSGEHRDRLLALAGAGELIVADGNHRTLAAQLARLPRFLAVITTPASVAIAPYNRLISDVNGTPEELIDRLRAAGAQASPISAPASIPDKGTVNLYARGQAWAIQLPRVDGASMVDNLDHALVERHIIVDGLGLDAGDKRVAYVGGDYSAEWLTGEVDAGRAALAILIAPVSVDDFVAVNLARLKLPRKSTWFTPKARAGLVAAPLF